MRAEVQSHRRRPAVPPRPADQIVVDLARFRYALRKFLRFSENAARLCGVTPQQHQLLLGVAGFTGRGSATVSELAEFLQGRHHSVLGLVERAEQSGLVRSRKSDKDRRVVVVSLTRRGKQVLAELTGLHHEQAKRLRTFLEAPELRKLAEDDEPPADGKRTAERRSSVRRRV